jgi:hypothetical protein
MLYTRHFYRIDEVKAALQLCIQRRRLTESMFWTLELIESDETTSLQQVLLNTWFHNIGLANINILNDIFEFTINPFTLVNSMVYCARDCSLPVMFIYGISNGNYKNRNIVFTLPDDLIQSNVTIDTFIRACVLGKYLDSWLLSIPLWKNTDIIVYIERILQHKYTAPYISRIFNYINTYKYINKWYSRCILIGLSCFQQKYYNEPTNYLKPCKPDVLEEIEKWKNIYSRRYRRIYPIPKDCLIGRTYRGTLTYQDNNIEELYNPEYLICNSSIIKDINEKYGSYISLTDDDDECDKFMNWYFPDDIPDEWSLDDQQKSHGIGVNQKCDKPNILRYFNRWVDLKNDSKIWDKETIALKSLQSIFNNFTRYYTEDEIFNKYKEKSAVKNIWNMKSLKLILSSLE